MISRSALVARLALCAETLGATPIPAGASVEFAVGSLSTGLGAPRAETSYLLLAVLRAVIPQAEEVVVFERRWRLDGAPAVLEALVARVRREELRRPLSAPTVQVLGGTIVDVHDTAHTTFTTGIQRVVRSTLAQWAGVHALTLVAWTAGFTAPRLLSPTERVLVDGGAEGVEKTLVVVPWNARYVLPEIATDERRASRLRAIALYSGSRAVAVGHDCIPITSAETAGGGMPGGFARYLSALAEFDAVAATSGSSSAEFSGWRRMLGGAGLRGPEIRIVGLPTADGVAASPDAAAELIAAGVDPADRLVLAVGSHEPRKNHLALLQAAELAWRDGARFTLVIVGGNSWDAGGFHRALDAARARGRRVITLSSAPDTLVWALYGRAEFTVFPSLNEGFGLPVAESISRGVPVITSDFGSMRELAEGRGGLLVDPRDDAALAAGIRTLLDDPERLDALRAETHSAPRRGWAEYAAELWNAVEGQTA